MRDHRQTVTIKQVAERAGVSLMTVSRVMNDNTLVRPTTRDKVLKAIDELNYRPNLSARRLAGGKSLYIGLVYHNQSPGYLAKILRGSLDACRRGGHHLVLEDLGEQTPFKKPHDTARALKSAGLDGIVIVPPLSNHAPFIESMEELGLSVVRIAPEDIHGSSLRVAMDDVLAARRMVDHIVEKGHTRIGFIKGPMDHPSAEHRLRGFQNAMAEHGISMREDYTRDGDFTYRSGFDMGRELLTLDEPPTAIFASNDDMAAGVVAMAYMLGLKVPQDVSVVGFDDTEIATNIWPPLTTIKQPIEDMARRAVDLVTAHIRGDDVGVERARTLLEFELMDRDTVTPPS